MPENSNHKRFEEYALDFVNIAVKEQEAGYKSNSPETLAQYKERLKLQMLAPLTAFKEKFESGYFTLLSEISKNKEKNVDDYKVSEEKLAHIKDSDFLMKSVLEGDTFQKLLGFTNEQMLDLYEVCTKLIDQKRFEDSQNAFMFLLVLNPTISSFWTGLGVIWQQEHRLQEALFAFKVAIIHKMDSIEPYLSALRCCLEMQDHEEANRLLQIAIEMENEDVSNVDLQKLKAEAQELQKYIKNIKK